MRNGYLVLLLTLTPVAALRAENRPAGVRVSTWVREDIFAGFMAGDLGRFEKGMEKLATVLAAQADSVDGLAWRGGGKLYLAVRAHEAGDQAAFDRHYADARADFSRAAAELANQPDMRAAYFAIRGGCFTIMADRLPAAHRKEAWTEVRTNYQALRETQKAFFDKMPLHMRGEVLAGMAQAAQRVGDQPGAKAAMQELLAALPDSVYASRARKWQEQPALAERTSLVCQTCHDSGRLEPVLQKMSEAKAR